MDTFTCGTCSTIFNDLDDFINHKQASVCTVNESTKASAQTSTSIISADLNPGSTESNVHVGDTANTATEDSSTAIIADSSASIPVTLTKVIVDDPQPAAADDDEHNSAAAAVYDDDKQDKLQDVVVEPVKDCTNAPVIYTCNYCDTYTSSLEEMTAHCREHHNVTVNIGNHYKCIKPLGTQSYDTKAERKQGKQVKLSTPTAKFEQAASVDGIGNEKLPVMILANNNAEGEKPKRRRGRPRKSQQVAQPLHTSPEEETLKEMDKRQSFLDEENLMCRNCNRKFKRLRQLHNHRCLVDEIAKVLKEHVDEEVDDNDDGGDNDINITTISDVKASQGKKSEIVKVNVSEEEQLRIEASICEHEIPQLMNDKVPTNHRTSKNKLNTLKVYTCPYCDKFFKFKQAIIHHVRLHTGYKPHKCKSCTYASISKGNLTIHERKHTGERFKCPLCKFTCISKGHLKVHQRSHKKIRIICELCHKNAYNLTNLLRHLKSSHEIDTPGRAQKYYEKKRMESREGKRSLLFQCNICNRKFKTKSLHDIHLLLHQDQKPFQCCLCGYKAVRERYLYQHFRRHRQVYICSLCGENYLSIQLLDEHLQTHMTDENNSEQEHLLDSIHCSIYFAEVLDPELESAHLSRISSGDIDATSVDYLQDSSSLASGVDGSMKYGGEVVPEEELKTIFGVDQVMLKYKRLNKQTVDAIQKLYGELECKECGKLFMYKAYLENHTRIHLDEKEFKCSHEDCDYSSNSRENLKVHEDCTHSGVQYKCSECDFQTTSNVYLQTHMRKHVIPGAYRCTQCDVTCGREQDIKDHIANTHPSMLQEQIQAIIGRRVHINRKAGQGWFQCKHCPQRFRINGEYRQHLWMHEGIAPYKCDICGHGARSMSNLRSHMLRHSDKKTHLCSDCGKAFKTKNSLKIHNLSQHTNTTEKDPSKILLKCELCDFTCIQKSQLKKHWEIHGRLRPYRCGVCIQYYSNTKSGLRSHYSKQHPEVAFDETLLQDEAPQDSTSIAGSVEQTIMQYKCSQCDVLTPSYQLLEEHLLKEHNLEVHIATTDNTSDDPAATLIQAAAMAESSEQVVENSGLQIKLPSNSAVELLQQIINMQGLGHLSSGSENQQVQIRLPISNSVSEATASAVENSSAVPEYAISEDQAMTYAVAGESTSQSAVTDEGQEQEGSSIMQVQFRVEDGEGGQQIYITQDDGDQQTYVEVPPEIQQAEVVQISISSGDASDSVPVQQQEHHQTPIQDNTNATEAMMQHDSITNVEIPYNN